MSAFFAGRIAHPGRQRGKSKPPCCKQQAGTRAPSYKNNDVLRSSFQSHTALPTTSETFVDGAEGRKTFKQLGVRVFITNKTCNLQTILLSLGTGRCMCLGIPVSSMLCVCAERECDFTTVVGWPTLARRRQRSEPNHVTRKLAGIRCTEHEESRRVFGPASRPANHFRNKVTECRSESLALVCMAPSKS